MLAGFSLNGRWKLGAKLFKLRNFDNITVVNGVKHTKQEEALMYLTDDVTTELGYGGGAGGGKSWVGCCWLTYMSLNYAGTRWFVGREEITLLEGTTLKTFEKVTEAYGIKKGIDWKYNANSHVITFTNGSEIFLLNMEYRPGESSPFNRFGSFEFTGGWIEEAAGVHNMAYEVIKTRIGRQHNDKYGLLKKLLVTFNPSHTWTYRVFYLPSIKDTLKHNVKFMHVLANQNPHIDSGYHESLDGISDLTLRSKLRDGNFDFIDDENCLCSSEDIEFVFNNYQMAERPVKRKCISADLAMQGRDSFVAGVGSTHMIRVAIRKQGNTGRQLEEQIGVLSVHENVKRENIIVDADGMGNYLSSYLQGIRMFHGNEVATNRIEFENAKSECAYKLAEKINKKELFIICSPEEKELISQELTMLRTKSNTADTKRKGIIPKDDMKQRIGRSPDILDMLIMMQSFDVKENNIFAISV